MIGLGRNACYGGIEREDIGVVDVEIALARQCPEGTGGIDFAALHFHSFYAPLAHPCQDAHGRQLVATKGGLGGYESSIATDLYILDGLIGDGIGHTVCAGYGVVYPDGDKIVERRGELIATAIANYNVGYDRCHDLRNGARSGCQESEAKKEDGLYVFSHVSVREGRHENMAHKAN